MPPVTGFRNPGRVVKLEWPLTEESVYAFNMWAKKIHEAHFGHPHPHAASHLREVGVPDSLGSSEDPEPVSFGAEADPGDPRGGYAAADHVHPLDADLEALEGLAGVETMELNGRDVTFVYSPEETKLLSLIVLELEKLNRK